MAAKQLYSEIDDLFDTIQLKIASLNRNYDKLAISRYQ